MPRFASRSSIDTTMAFPTSRHSAGPYLGNRALGAARGGLACQRTASRASVLLDANGMVYHEPACSSLLCVECCSAYAYHSAIRRLLVVARNTSLPCVSAIHLLHSQYVLIIRLCSTPAILAIRLSYSCAIRRWLYAARYLLLLFPDA